MTDSDTLQGRLEALLEQLAAGAIPFGRSSEDAASADSADMPEEVVDDHASTLAALAEQIGEAAESTEELLAAHPFAAIVAALVLGAAIGRMTAN